MKPLVLGLALVALSLGPVAALHGCTPAESEAAYAAQQAGCVDQAKTRAEADACRAHVRAAWGLDAGGDDITVTEAGTKGGDR